MLRRSADYFVIHDFLEAIYRDYVLDKQTGKIYRITRKVMKLYTQPGN